MLDVTTSWIPLFLYHITVMLLRIFSIIAKFSVEHALIFAVISLQLYNFHHISSLVRKGS